jgi:hypothetical protein
MRVSLMTVLSPQLRRNPYQGRARTTAAGDPLGAIVRPMSSPVQTIQLYDPDL